MVGSKPAARNGARKKNVMQITEGLIERIARKVFNAMFPSALRQNNVVTGSGGGSVQYAAEAGHAQTADTATNATNASNVPWSGVQNRPNFATVATSGNYNDLNNKPTIPTVPTNVSAFNNDAGYITSSGSCAYATSAGTATYANSAGSASSAGYATSAGSAGYATSAGDADTLDSHHASYFINTGGGQTISNNLQVASVKIEETNEINSYTGQLHLNYRVSTGVTLCNGGGNVGIGTTSPSYKLHVAGTIYATGSITERSDIRCKDVETYQWSPTLDMIADAPIIRYSMKDDETHRMRVGSVAQYWEKMIPETVSQDNDGILSMAQGDICMVNIIALAREVRRLKEEIKQLRNGRS